MSFFTLTKPSERNMPKAWAVGAFIGLIGAFVKWGWEVPFPPRNPHVGFPLDGMTGAVMNNGVLERVTPPQVFLDMLGLPHDWTYMFSGMEMPLSIFIVHVMFSVVFGIIYCVASEYYPVIRIWYGLIFAVVSNVLAHMVVMPLIGLVPPLSEIPFDENFSEMLGHIFWIFVMDLCRRAFYK